jgi:hypothetical protein
MGVTSGENPCCPWRSADFSAPHNSSMVLLRRSHGDVRPYCRGLAGRANHLQVFARFSGMTYTPWIATMLRWSAILRLPVHGHGQGPIPRTSVAASIAPADSRMLVSNSRHGGTQRRAAVSG